MAQDAGIRIAIENHCDSFSEEILWLLDRIDHPAVSGGPGLARRTLWRKNSQTPGDSTTCGEMFISQQTNQPTRPQPK